MGENICKLCDNGIIYRVSKRLQQLNNKTPNNLILKWTIDLNRQFSKDETQIPKRYMN